MEPLKLSEIQELSPLNKLENKNYEEITVYASELQNVYYKLKSAVNILTECSGIELPDEEIETVMSFYGKSFLEIYRYINKLEEYILNKKELLKEIVVRGQ
ncbi:hypothetical protein [Sebaldella sp. S0638]|uniref:hypothetical protein n=1 Tax=Sebaldella sp. S0638 TaxID=2957809 RepID=UPI00209E8C59|nr:hypothetical protein [Sebaldella sp. S0638]MCP1226534.1 hypothetical protein [Sebaldella sp. S0638]